MNLPFQPHRSAVLILLPENTDPNGKHMEYRDAQGTVFARMVKVYKRGGLFGLFPKDNHVHAELKDVDGTLLLTTTSYHGSTWRERSVEVNTPDGTLLGTLYDAPFGVVFERADGTALGIARRPEEPKTEPREVIHTYATSEGQEVGTCDRRFPNQSDSLLDLLTGTNLWGQPVQVVSLTAAVDPLLHTFLFLFPVLQHLRFSRSG